MSRTYKGRRLIIAGSRTVWDEEFVHRKLDALTHSWTIESVLCGMAEGPDLLGKSWAEKTRGGIPVVEFAADWDTHGKKAGFLRNKDMAEYAIDDWDLEGWLIAFLDVTNDANGSSGTNHMINLAREYGLKVDVVKCRCKRIEQ